MRSEQTPQGNEELLISELAYAVVRLHKDMYMLGRTETPVIHEVSIKTKLAEEVG